MSAWTTILAALAPAPAITTGMWRASGPPPMGEPQGAFERYGARTITTQGQVRSLTPARVVAYLAAADQGDPSQLSMLLQEVEDRSTHIVSVLGTRKRAVANLVWRLKPADDSAEAQQIAEAATAAVGRIKGLPQALLDLLDAVHKGYAATEITWKFRRGATEPAVLDYRPQQWLRPDRDDPNRWRLVDRADLINGVALVPNKWIVHISRAKSGFPVQAGLGRVLVWWYLFSSYAIQDWVSYGEKFGSPLRVGKYPSTASPADIDALQEALDQLGVDASAVVPKDMDIALVGDNAATRGPDVFERLVERANREISKAVLGQTLTTEEGQNGTQALGTVHNSVRADLRDSDAGELARTLTDQLLKPFVAYNFGPAAAESLCPIWEFETSPPQDRSAEADVQTKRAAVFQAAIALGLPVGIDQVREELGIRELQEGEAALKAPGSAVAALPLPGGEPAIAAAPAASSVADTALNGAQIASLLDILARISEGRLTVAGAIEMIQASFPTISPARAAALAAGAVVAPAAPVIAASAVAPARLPPGTRILAAGRVTVSPIEQLDASMAEFRLQVGRAWRELVAEIGRQLGDTVDPAEAMRKLPGILAGVNLGPYADPLAEAMLTAQALGLLQARAADSRKVDTLPPGSPFSVEVWAAALELPAATWSARVGMAQDKAIDAIRYALLSMARDYVTTLETVAGTEDAAEAAHDALEAEAESPLRTEAVVEGASTSAWGAGRMEGVGSDPRRPFFRYHTMEDNRVRPAHRAMEGRVYPADHPIWKVWTPPNGFGCRCWLTAHSAAEVEAAGWDVMDSYPAIPDDKNNGKPNPKAGEPAIPDPGWTSSRGAPPHDLADFPAPLREAVDAAVAKHAAKMAAKKGGAP